jgi:hypothetical protein
VVPSEKLELAIDPELARLALGLNKTGEYFVWCVAHHHFGEPGHTSRDQLHQKIQDTGVIVSRRHFNRLLKQGDDLLWGLDNYGKVYLRGWEKVADRLTQVARQTHPQLIQTNLPGARRVFITTGDNLTHFKAQIYAGWLTYRQDPTIARDTLATLFNCTKATLRNWEKTLGPQLKTTPNYAQTALDPKKHNQIADYIPPHSYNYVTQQGQIRIRWRQPNTYHTSGIREHAHKGQARKARTAAVKTAWYQPVELGAPTNLPYPVEKLAFDRSHRVPKQYFQSPEELQRLLKRLAKKGKPGATPQTPRYVYLGPDQYRQGIWELSLDGYVSTKATERLSIKAEYTWWKNHRRFLELARDVARRSA